MMIRIYGKFKNVQNVPYYEKLKQKATMSESQYRDSMILEACQQKRLHTYVDYNFEVGNIRYDHGFYITSKYMANNAFNKSFRFLNDPKQFYVDGFKIFIYQQYLN